MVDNLVRRLDDAQQRRSLYDRLLWIPPRDLKTKCGPDNANITLNQWLLSNLFFSATGGGDADLLAEDCEMACTDDRTVFVLDGWDEIVDQLKQDSTPKLMAELLRNVADKIWMRYVTSLVRSPLKQAATMVGFQRRRLVQRHVGELACMAFVGFCSDIIVFREKDLDWLARNHQELTGDSGLSAELLDASSFLHRGPDGDVLEDHCIYLTYHEFLAGNLVCRALNSKENIVVSRHLQQTRSHGTEG
ncbi:hypothetical protein MCOR25_003928 [Pyricularia grisea]|nr:hypothetical protein MCOR25_003928 [Pyricularia grisea]